MSTGERDPGRTLVTGAGGFIGRALVSALTARGIDTVASDAAPGGAWLRCDVTDFDRLRELVNDERIGTIIHCGAVSGPMVLAGNPLAVWRINAGGTANVLETARRAGVGRVVVCSSTEVYGATQGRVDEQTPADPASVYAASKLAAEQATLAWARQHGVDALALRLAWIYGPGRVTETQLETLLLNALEGRETMIDGAETDWTHYLHVTDALDALIAAALAPTLGHRLYNVSGGRGVSVGELLDTVRRLVPGGHVVFSGAGDRQPATIANDRIAADLGATPRISLEDGLGGYLHVLASSRSRTQLRSVWCKPA